jgi:hypothetical protein
MTSATMGKVTPLFPLRPSCPACGGTRSRDNGRSAGGSYAKRRCRLCGCSFRTLPLAYRVHDDHGERIVPAPDSVAPCL